MAVRKLFLLTTSVLTGAVLMAAGSASAADQPTTQTTPPTTTQPPPPPGKPSAGADKGTEVGELVVTGSRIRRSNFTSASPIQVITAEDSKLEGLVNPTDVLQRSTIAAGSVQLNNQFSQFVVNGGEGVNTISLRGLGGQRTLVLLNGRRLNPAGVSGTVAAVDLNVIPEALIDRYEILKDGASSVYGSDAIGGVVNIITRDKFDGLTVEADGALPSSGKGQTWDAAVSFGRVRDNYHILGDIEAFQQDRITVGDLPHGACPRELQRLPTGGAFNFSRTNFDGTPYCFFPQTDFVADFSNQKTFVLDPNNQFGNVFGSQYSPFKQDGFGHVPRHTNIATDPRGAEIDALSPVKRYSATLLGGADLPNRTELYFEGLITERVSDESGFLPQFFPAKVADIINVSFNAFNPFPDFVQPVMTVPPAQLHQDVTAGRALVGLRGDFGSSNFLKGWKWDGYVSYGRSQATYVNHPQVASRINNALDVMVAPAGFDPSLVRHNPVDGLNYTCSINLSNPAERCYPLNWFVGHQAFLSDPALAYISATDTGHTTYDQVVASATADGPLFHLPAGELQAVLGAEVRYDDLNDTPGPIARGRDAFNLSTSGITKGNESVWEIYGELEAPLLKAVPLFDSLVLNVAGRYTSYRTAGSNGTYKVSLNWQVIPSFRLRGAYGTSFRGPALFENFLAAQTSFTGARDPCALYGANFAPTDNTFKNCASEGLPPTFVGFSSTPEVFSQGALGRLKPETSKNLTVGPVWQPSFIDLEVSVDYYRIEVDNEISQLGPSNLLNLCYGSTLFHSGSPFCSLISARDVNHNIQLINDSFVNVARQITSGLDFSVRYGKKFSFGDLRFEGEATYNFEDNQELFPGAGLTNFVGTFGEPKFNANATLRFRHGSWTGSWNTFYLGPQSNYALENQNPVNNRFQLLQHEQYYHTVALTYEGDKWSATLGVRNVFGEYPPTISANAFPFSQSRSGEFSNGNGNLQLFGRTVFFNLKKTF